MGLRGTVRRISFCVLALILWGASVQAKSVKLQWNPVEGAASYEIQILTENGSAVVHKTEDPYWKGQLGPGAYTYQIRAIDEAKREGTWSEPKSLAVMPEAPHPKFPKDGEKIQTYAPSVSTELKWEPVPGASKYVVELQKDGGTPTRTEVDQAKLDLKNLSDGKYKWSVKAVVQPHGRTPASLRQKKWETKAGDQEEFRIIHKKLEAPRLVSPLRVEPPPEDGKIKLKWKEVEGAKSYEVQISKAKDKARRAPASELAGVKRFVTKDVSLTSRVSGDGSYAWGVRALASVDQNKVPEAVGPESYGEFQLDKNAVFKGDLGYVALSTMAAPYTYQIVSPSNGFSGSTSSFSTLVRASGEIWLAPQWALGVGADYSFFELNNQTFNRFAVELTGKYRIQLSSGLYGWSLSPKLGAEVRTYNQIVPTDLVSLGGSLSDNPLMVLGAVAGLDIRKQFSRNFSLGAKVGYFFPVKALSGAPGDAKFDPGTSYRNLGAGLQGMYWLSPSLGLGVGAYIESRSIGYTSSSSSGLQTVTTNGTYFFGSVVYRFWK